MADLIGGRRRHYDGVFRELRNMMADLIDRKTVIETVRKCAVKEVTPAYMLIDKAEVMTELMMLPSVQPEPLSDAYMKAVWTWLLDYQIKAAELKGKYTPYEVLSWVANDWRKEHEGSD